MKASDLQALDKLRPPPRPPSAGRKPRASSFASSISDVQPELPSFENPIRQKSHARVKDLLHVDEAKTGMHSLAEFFRRNSGLCYMCASQFGGAIMNVSTRVLETKSASHMHPLQILFARMIITCAACFFYCYVRHINVLGPKEFRLVLLGRAVFGFMAVYGLYYSLSYLSLSNATVITFLGPIVTGFVCWAVLHEPFTRNERLAGLFSLVGVVLIAKPESFFSSSSDPTTSATAAESGVSPHQRLVAVLVALLGVFGGAGSFTSIRYIGRRVNALINVLYFSAMCVLVSFFSLIFIPRIGFSLPAGREEWLLLLLLGVAGFAMQILLTFAIQRTTAGRAGAMVYLQIIYALGFEKAIWNTTPDALSIAGSSLILGGAAWVALSRSSAEGKEEPADEEEAVAMMDTMTPVPEEDDDDTE